MSSTITNGIDTIHLMQRNFQNFVYICGRESNWRIRRTVAYKRASFRLRNSRARVQFIEIVIRIVDAVTGTYDDDDIVPTSSSRNHDEMYIDKSLLFIRVGDRGSAGNTRPAPATPQTITKESWR